jgi:uncharacterized Tic20 family protein
MDLSQNEKAYAGLAHALMIPTWWIGPLVIYVTQEESRFVRFHALQALFWQILYTFLSVAGMVVIFVVVFTSVLSMPEGKAAEPGQFPIAFFVVLPFFWLLMMGGLVTSITLGIIYCLKAMRAPLIGSWVRRILGA